MTYKSKDWVFTLLALAIVVVGSIVNLGDGAADEESYSHPDDSYYTESYLSTESSVIFDTPAEPSAEVQDGIIWDLTGGVLTVAGNGAMQDYEIFSTADWLQFKDEIKEIVIEEGVTYIGHRAFWECYNVEKVTVADSVTYIQNNAFASCGAIKEINLGNGVTHIGENAFGDCNSLETIYIPASVTSIGYGAFYSCISLKTVYYGGSQYQWSSIAIDGYNYAFEDAEKIYNYIP